MVTMKGKKWNYSVIGYDTYANELFSCEVMLKPPTWQFWRKKKMIVLVGGLEGWYNSADGIRVPREMEKEVMDWFRSWKTRQEASN